MFHELSNYKDGWQKIAFCLNCGKEGNDLIGSCQGGNPVPLICGNCGQSNNPFELPCKNCNRIREMFKKAIDKQNSRN